MMNLNLLPSSAKFQAAKIRLQKKVRLVLMSMLGVWIVGVGIVFGLNAWANSQLTAANKKYDKTNAAYLGLKDEVVTSQELKHRAKLVAQVLDKRFEYGRAFEIVQKLFGEGVTLEKYDLVKLGLFEIEGRAVGKEAIEELEKTIVEINAGKREGLKQAKMTNLALRSGSWRFSMEVSLK